jgi:hypothetical protein
MPKAARATNKTEFQRYLNDHPESVAVLLPLYRRYKAAPRKPRSNELFGFWLRRTDPVRFCAAYARFWLKHAELHDKVYDNVVPDLAGQKPCYHQSF